MDKTMYKFGFWAGLVSFASGTAFVVVQALQLLRILNFPWDEILIYGFSLGMSSRLCWKCWCFIMRRRKKKSFGAMQL
jgi:hypothetical protein